MPDFDFSTLITDRSASDLELLRDLLSTPVSEWTDSEKAEFNLARSKGAYNHTDLNRVTQCMEYLDETLRSYGYQTGYQKIKIPRKGSGKLPEGYTELEYIESTGTQYIDTGFKPNQDTRVVMDAYLQKRATGATYFISLAEYEPQAYFQVRITSSAQYLTSDFGNDTKNLSEIPLPGRYVIDKNKNVCTVGTESVLNTENEFQAQSNLLLLAGTTTAGVRSISSGIIYSCKIYDNGTLTRDFVPCKDPSGEVGLYDLVGEQFYGNAGTGTFLASSTPAVLPEGYTELSYLYSTGDAYINTGISGIFKASFDIKFDLSGTRVLMGQGTGTGQYWGKDASNQPELGGGIAINFDLTQRSTVIFEKTSSAAVLTANNSTVQRASTTTTSPFLLFRTGGSDWASYSGGIAIYSCAFEQNGQQVLDLVPCENPDGELGFFDLINEEFYANAGSGSFTAGPEVPAPGPEPTLDPYTWYEADVPTVSTMEAYLGNVAALRSVLTLPEDTAQVPGDMAGLTQTEANQIEEILSVIHAYLEAMVPVFRRCGAAICGGPGFYFLN